MSLGLAQPFARPARATLVGAAVLFGAVSVTFSLGLETGFSRFQDERSAGFNDASVIVVPGQSDSSGDPQRPDEFHGPNDPRTPHLDPAKVSAALASVPGTEAAFGWGDSGATIIGAPTGDRSEVDTVSGNFSWTGLELISGRWYSGPGEAVVSDELASAMGTHVGDTLTVVQSGKPLALKVVGIDFDTHDGGRSVLVDSATFSAGGLTPRIDQFNVELGANVSGPDWAASATAVLSPLNASVDHEPGGNRSEVVLTMSALVATLSVMLLAVAALGVLNTVVQDTRERIHDLGIFKALGMTPRQTVSMVLTSVALTGLVAGLIGVPIGTALEKATITPMGNAVGMHLPPSVTNAYSLGLLLPLLAGGAAIAVLGALLPAGWAARSRTATALRTE
jgi:putative ABC transport system permease protein